MEKYVYSLGLIPVQEWIAQARRSRDLRAGSVFLWQTLAPLLARLEEEGEIWLPSPPAGGFAELAGLTFARAFSDARYGIPHRASGVLEANEEDDVRNLFAELEDRLLSSWITFRDRSLVEPRFDARAYWQELAPVWQAYRAAHADGGDCPFHLVWAARPAPFPLEDRKENLKAIDRLYAEVKRARPLRPWRSGSAAGKCNQCGQREAVGPGTSFEAWRAFHLRHEQDRWIREGFRLDPGERLCFVCLAKRMAGYEAGDGNFPSTGEIAAASWLAKAEELAGKEPESSDGKTLRQALERLRRSELGGRDLGRVLYASESELERLGLDEDQRHDVLEPRKQLAEALGAAPPGYLALLTFDGDEMGRHMQEDSERLSGLLADFAAAAARLLEAAGGRAFYLAGDEGLAMVPADRALGLALELRDAFEDIAAGGGDRPTLSVGIAFFEQSRPMRGAIQAARAALREAKEQPGKNALGVAVQTASGNRWSFTAPWGDDWTRVCNAVRLIQANALSPGWAYDAERFLATIPDGEWNDGDVVAAARAEVRRLFLRRVRLSEVDEKEKEDGEEETRLARKKALWRELPGESWWPRDEESGLLARARPEQFHLIGFLAREGAVPVKEEA